MASSLSKDAVGHLSGLRMLPKHKHHAASPDDPDNVLRDVQMFCLAAVNAHHLVLDLQHGRLDGRTGARSWYASKEMDRLGEDWGGLRRHGERIDQARNVRVSVSVSAWTWESAI